VLGDVQTELYQFPQNQFIVKELVRGIKHRTR